MMQELGTKADITWCPGCGNFGILNAVKKAVTLLEAEGVSRESLFVVGGIGCHGKIMDYLNLSSLYAIHGRGTAVAQGVKLANPALNVIAFGGDGDAYGEGLEHTVFAAKRNADVTLIVHNNGTYALTTGQFSPTSSVGFKGPSAPRGSVEPPLNPLSLLLEAGATFVARGYAGRLDHLEHLIVAAVKHRGFSLVDVLQPSVVFNNTYKEYNKLVRIMEKPAGSLEEAVRLAKESSYLPIGVFYQVEQPVFHEGLYGGWNPVFQRLSREKRREPLRRMLTPFQEKLTAKS
jgi:2-oxoglutarate/2-oxoacid ferredoxin oxidoreductase subunit beta